VLEAPQRDMGPQELTQTQALAQLSAWQAECLASTSVGFT